MGLCLLGGFFMSKITPPIPDLRLKYYILLVRDDVNRHFYFDSKLVKKP